MNNFKEWFNEEVSSPDDVLRKAIATLVHSAAWGGPLEVAKDLYKTAKGAATGNWKEMAKRLAFLLPVGLAATLGGPIGAVVAGGLVTARGLKVASSLYESSKHNGIEKAVHYLNSELTSEEKENLAKALMYVSRKHKHSKHKHKTHHHT